MQRAADSPHLCAVPGCHSFSGSSSRLYRGHPYGCCLLLCPCLLLKPGRLAAVSSAISTFRSRSVRSAVNERSKVPAWRSSTSHRGDALQRSLHPTHHTQQTIGASVSGEQEVLQSCTRAGGREVCPQCPLRSKAQIRAGPVAPAVDVDRALPVPHAIATVVLRLVAMQGQTNIPLRRAAPLLGSSTALLPDSAARALQCACAVPLWGRSASHYAKMHSVFRVDYYSTRPVLGANCKHSISHQCTVLCSHSFKHGFQQYRTTEQ
jgi:hypothetical protein